MLSASLRGEHRLTCISLFLLPVLIVSGEQVLFLGPTGEPVGYAARLDQCPLLGQLGAEPATLKPLSLPTSFAEMVELRLSCKLLCINMLRNTRNSLCPARPEAVWQRHPCRASAGRAQSRLPPVFRGFWSYRRKVDACARKMWLMTSPPGGGGSFRCQHAPAGESGIRDACNAGIASVPEFRGQRSEQ